MASHETLEKLAQNPDWLPPRSDLRVFLGQPGAPEATKTTVEPGNVFSPGMFTFGVTWWLRFPDNNHFFATETAPLESLWWHYEEGYLPVLHCLTRVDGLEIEHILFQDGDCDHHSEAVAARLSLTNATSHPINVELFLALRSLGPAGGPLYNLKAGQDGKSLRISQNDLPLLVVDLPPAAVGCGVGDPSPLARQGAVPVGQMVEDPAGWCFGLLRYDLTLGAGAKGQVTFDCPQQTYGNLERELPGSAIACPEKFEARQAALSEAWKLRFHEIGLDVPDADFRNAFYASIQHLLTAMVGDQPRIAALSYPLPWLRDSVFIIHSLDLAGFHEQARAACNYIARNDFFGGFGAEGDAPGEGIWALVQHYRLNKDRAWLAEIYLAIQRKVDWLRRMRRADKPIQIFTDTPTLAFTHGERCSGVICLAGENGIIQGTMDHGVSYSLGWVNHWAICGLREAAFAAAELGHKEDALAYESEADDLQQALQRFSQKNRVFFEYERTVNSLLWPTRAWESSIKVAEAGFNAWYLKNRENGEHFQPEPYWLYFESSQAHNALLFGQRQRAWQVVDYRLRHQDLPGLYGWREGGNGIGTENAVHGVTLIPMLRGCQKFESITPHGWSQAELWLLQRALLVEEWGDGLLLFAGVPQEWLKPEAHIGFRDFPTWYGKVTADLDLDDEGYVASIHISGATPGTPLTIRLPGQEVRINATEKVLALQINLVV